MGIFLSGGNTGFFLGPIVAGALVSGFGLPGTLVLLPVGLLTVALLLKVRKLGGRGEELSTETADAPSGNSYYILSVDASYSGADTWNVHPFNFQVVSSSSSVYPATQVLSERNPLSDVTLSNGQHDVGQLAFELPHGQAPSKLEYIAQFPTIKIEIDSIPQASRWVSSITYAVVNFQTSTGSSHVFGGALAACSGFYYTGDTITVKIPLSYTAYSGIYPSSVTVTSVVESDQGFTISSVQPSLPLTVAGNGREVDIIVNIPAPQYSYSGNMHLVVTVST